MKYFTELMAIATKLMPSRQESTVVKATSRVITPTNETCDAQWITLSQLPRLTQDAIRAMGKAVFGPLTNTPLSNIEVIANLAGQGPHSQREIDITANRLRCTTDPSNILEYSSDQMKHLFGGAYQA